MTKLLTIATLLFSLIACAQQKNNTLSVKEKKNGWKLLFDGTTTNGWHSFNKTTVGSSWKVKNSILCLDTLQNNTLQNNTGGDIVTDDIYADFHLKLEWKISKNGNSGIMFFVQEGPQYDYPWRTGPEMQILDNDGHNDGKIIKHRAGDLYDLIKSSQETAKAIGQWNKVEIINYKGELTFKLNNVAVVNTNIMEETWQTMIAGSKFKDMPDFGKFSTGKIVLQDHGNEVCFRNIKIKALK